MTSERHKRVETLAHRLRGVEAAPNIARSVLATMLNETELDAQDDVELLIVNGYGELIDKFNNTELGSIHDAEFPGIVGLKHKLQGNRLPSLSDLNARDLAIGTKNARDLMIKGQVALRAAPPDTDALSEAILAPSQPTNLKALAVGTAGHIIERTIMAHIMNLGIDTSDWDKDTVLRALQHSAKLMYCEAMTYGANDEPLLLDIFVKQHSHEESGGLEWGSQRKLDEAYETYQEVETHYKNALLDEYPEFFEDSDGGNLALLSYNEMLEIVCANQSLAP